MKLNDVIMDSAKSSGHDNDDLENTIESFCAKYFFFPSITLTYIYKNVI